MPTVAAALAKLARGDPDTLSSYLVQVEQEIVLDNTKTTSHCYFIAVDGNGQLRTSAFIRRICEHVIDFAMPRTQIREASEFLKRTGSSQKWARLTRDAESLFNDLATTGEGGELVLFILAEHVLRLPQIICKMSLKTSAGMHYHGADGVHARIDPDTGALSLYWGEAKMYQRPAQAISACLDSLAPFLRDEDVRGSARTRDINLLSSFVDLDDPTVENAIKAYLDPDNPAFNRLQYCGLAFVGFDPDIYPPSDQRAVAEAIAAAVKTSIVDWRTHIGQRVLTERLEQFEIHFICLPFPSVDDFRSRFLSEMGVNRVTT